MTTAASLDTLLTTIAREELFVETLTIRGRDSLDFHDCGVERIRSALERAFRAGQASQVTA